MDRKILRNRSLEQFRSRSLAQRSRSHQRSRSPWLGGLTNLHRHLLEQSTELQLLLIELT